MSDALIFSVGGLVFIATTWASIAFALSKVIGIENNESGVERNEVVTLPSPSNS